MKIFKISLIIILFIVNSYGYLTSHEITKTITATSESIKYKSNINIAHGSKDLSKLNRNKDDINLDLYDVKSDVAVSAQVDTRMLSKEGRAQISEDILKTGMVAETIKLIATTDKVNITDFFSETDKSHKTYEAVKEKIKTNPKLASALQNPDLTPQQKEAMLNDITDTVMTKLGYKTYENKLVSTNETGRDDKEVKGFYSTDTGNSYINDKNIESTDDLVKTAGWEATRAMDHQNDVDFDTNREDRATYADSFGGRLSSYTNGALNINGYDGMASSNSHIGTNTNTPSVFNQHIRNNNNEFKGLNKDNGDNFGLVGGAIGVGVEFGVQMIINKGDISKTDWTDVVTMGAAGAVAPSILGSISKLSKSGKAIKVLKGQQDRARTTNKMKKLDGRIDGHKNKILNSIEQQVIWNAGKQVVKQLDDEHIINATDNEK